MTFEQTEQLQELGEKAARIFLFANRGADLIVEIAAWEAVPDQLRPRIGDVQRICLNDFAWGFAQALRAELMRRGKSAA
jgi:hypothetical protein